MSLPRWAAWSLLLAALLCGGQVRAQSAGVIFTPNALTLTGTALGETVTGAVGLVIADQNFDFIEDISIANNPNDWSVSDDCGEGSSCTATVSYTPSEFGESRARLDVIYVQTTQVLCADEPDAEGCEAFFEGEDCFVAASDVCLVVPEFGVSSDVEITESIPLTGRVDAPDPATISFDQAGRSGDEGSTLEVGLTRAGEPGSAPDVLRVRVTAVPAGDSPATAGSDYRFAPQTFVWDNTEFSSRDVRIDLLDDDVANEGPERVDLVLEILSDGPDLRRDVPGAFARTSITINDTTPVPDPLVVVRSVDNRVTEAGRVARMVLGLSSAPAGNASVNYALGGGTATPGADYAQETPRQGSFRWQQGSTDDQTLSVDIALDDVADEPDETFVITLSGADGVRLNREDATQTVTIVDSTVVVIPDPIIVLSDIDRSVRESDERAQVVLALDGENPEGASVRYTLAGGSATLGTDYAESTPASGTISWPAGNTDRRTLDIDILTDDLEEDDETFNVSFAGASNATLDEGLSPQTITIEDSTDIPDPVIVVRRVSTPVTEAAGEATVVLGLEGRNTEGVSVTYTLAGGSATRGSDYAEDTPVTGTITWAANDTSDQTLEIDIASDEVEEPNETFNVSLTAPVNADLDEEASPRTITIQDSTDIPAPVIVVRRVSTPVTEAAGEATVVLGLEGRNTEGVSVTYTLAGGSATRGSDYAEDTPVTGTITWAANDTSDQTLEIDIASDELEEDNETFNVSLTAPVNADLDEEASPRTITIQDSTDIPDPVIVVRSVSTPVTEAAGEATVVLGLEGRNTEGVSVTYTLAGGSATRGSDYAEDTPVTGTITWEANDTDDQTLEIDIASDEVEEPNETFNVSLTAPVNADLDEEASPRTITIQDSTDIPDPVIVVRSVSTPVTEVAGEATVVLGLEGRNTEGVSVTYTLAGGSATRGGDYAEDTPVTDTITWAANDTSDQTLEIDIAADEVANEPDETFNVTLSGPVNADLDAEASPRTITIEDSTVPPEPGQIRFAATTLSVDEDAGTADLVLERVGGTDGAVEVTLTVAEGTASAGDDYTAGTLVAGWGDDEGGERTVEIPIIHDFEREANETFTVRIAGATGAGSVSTVTITEVANGAAGSLAFVAATTVADEDAGTVTIDVARTAGRYGAVSVNYELAGGTATEGGDFTLTEGTLRWAAGEAGNRGITLRIIPDTGQEDDETIELTLSGQGPAGSGVVLGGNRTHVATIPANDEPDIIDAGVITLADTTLDVSEVDGTITVVVERGGEPNGQVSVDYATANGSAAAPDDYTAATGTLEWADGDDDDKTIVVPIVADTLDEDAETFTVVLSNAEAVDRPGQDLRVRLGETTAQVTIADTPRPGTVAVEVISDVVLESDPGIDVVFRRINGSDGILSTAYETEAGTATEADDYIRTAGTIVWQDGESDDRTVRIPVLSDDFFEGDERFVLNYTAEFPDGAFQDDFPPLVVTIRDDGAPPAGELQVVSGDGQQGVREENLDAPLVVRYVGTDENDAPPAVEVVWRVFPTDAAELVDGNATRLDDQGTTSNRIRPLTSGPIIVEATLVGAAPATFSLRAGRFLTADLTPNQSATAGAIDSACEALAAVADGAVSDAGQDLLATCNELDERVDDGSVGAALERLAHEELFVIADSITATADLQITNIYSRMNALRKGRVDDRLDVSGLQFDLYGQRIPGSVTEAAQDALSGGGAAADGDLVPAFGAFVNGSVSTADVDGGDSQRDAQIDAVSLTVGVDYRINDQMVVGAGIGFVDNSTDFTGGEGEAEVSSNSISLFGTWYEAATGYVDAVLDIGQSGFDITRRINLPNTPDQFAVGDTDADVTSFTVGFGRTFSPGAWEFGPYGRVSLVSASVDGYSERATEAAAGFGSILNVDPHDVESTTIAIGFQASRTISTSKAVLVPQLRIELETERESRKEGITASFAADPEANPFLIQGTDRDERYLNIGLGGSVVMANGRSGYLFYETQAQNDYVTQHWVKLGIRLEF